MRRATYAVLFLAALSGAAQLSADTVTLTYYYNSLDSNPDDFTGMLTVQADEAPQDVPILTFSLSAVVDGQTLNFTEADQSGPAEAQYDTNPSVRVLRAWGRL